MQCRSATAFRDRQLYRAEIAGHCQNMCNECTAMASDVPCLAVRQLNGCDFKVIVSYNDCRLTWSRHHCIAATHLPEARFHMFVQAPRKISDPETCRHDSAAWHASPQRAWWTRNTGCPMLSMLCQTLLLSGNSEPSQKGTRAKLRCSCLW